MNDDDPSKTFEIRKYPNRRFYDATHRRHATLADLYDLVRRGHRITVTDSKSGEDITNVVLTQIILEHDPPKLDLFPASLLHQAIQTNQQMVRQFIDRYFAQAMDAFVRSGRQFEAFLRQAGMAALPPTGPLDWTRMLFGGTSPGGVKNPESSAPPTDKPDEAASESQSLQALRQEVKALGRELERLRPRRTVTKRPARRTASRRRKRR